MERSFPSTDDEVVGFAEDAKIIMEKLIGGTKEQNKLDVISIFGMAGKGKTTLTRKVYDNPSIVSHFDVRVWCAVSQTFTVRKLFEEILKQSKRGTDEINDDIADKARKSLKGRRYLIVLDDMWDSKAWEDLRLFIPDDEIGSRVMVTTRIEEVANQLKHCSDPYPLRFLTEEESWALLKKRVFRGENSCPPDLLEAGQVVAKHCEGLPLVIVLIAGIISNMERRASLWLKIANDLSSHILGEQSVKAIQLSYDHLDGHLKPPLLYMAYYFLEDETIPVSDLLQYWMAEELVHNMQAEEVKVCMNELVNRSLVMVSKRSNKNGDMKLCMLHDVVREFCLRKLAEENSLQRILPLDNSREPRLCLYLSPEDLYDEFDEEAGMAIHIIKEKKLLDQYFDHPSLEFVLPPFISHPSHVAELKFIRTLNLEVEEPSYLLEELKSTNHLRYLELSLDGNHFDFELVSHLCHLQTLKILSYMHITTSIAPFWKMEKLSHVDINGFSFMWEENDIANFNSNSSSGTPVLLENLKFFGEYRISTVDMNMQFWNRFPNLENFRIDFKDVEFENTTTSPLPGHGNVHQFNLTASFPSPKNRESGHSSSCLFPFYYIKELRLERAIVKEDMLSYITSLPNLECLIISSVNYVERTCWELDNYEFHALKYFKLQWLNMLHELRCSEETFPVLERLVLKDCRDLEEIPGCFADIPTLKLIKVSGCGVSVGESALNIKKEVEDTTGCDSLQVLVKVEEEDTESEEE